ncbi:hypothetical protein B0H13DRAFT_2345312 [Mycena leptocephala]|nr:hypothetical protein B0H13DRAFT_2345312 [Mycena leptocephala]
MLSVTSPDAAIDAIAPVQLYDVLAPALEKKQEEMRITIPENWYSVNGKYGYMFRKNVDFWGKEPGGCPGMPLRTGRVALLFQSISIQYEEARTPCTPPPSCLLTTRTPVFGHLITLVGHADNINAAPMRTLANNDVQYRRAASAREAARYSVCCT